MSTGEVTVLDDHRSLAVHTTKVIAAMALVLVIVLLATRRADALGGLVAGTVVGIANVWLLARSLSRFGGGPALNPRALGIGMFTRFLTIGGLLGLVLCVRQLNPLATLVGFLLMPAAVAAVGSRAARTSRTVEAVDARR